MEGNKRPQKEAKARAAGCETCKVAIKENLMGLTKKLVIFVTSLHFKITISFI